MVFYFNFFSPLLNTNWVRSAAVYLLACTARLQFSFLDLAVKATPCSNVLYQRPFFIAAGRQFRVIKE
jgi:hypothetical protein